MIGGEGAIRWLGSRYYALGALGLVSFVTSLMLLSLLLGRSAPSWLYPFLQVCGYDPVRGTAPFGKVVLLVAQAYLTMAVIAFFFWGDLKTFWHGGIVGLVPLTVFIAAPLAVFSVGVGAGRVEVVGPLGQPMVREGYEAPDFELVDSSGQLVRLSDLRGKVVLVTYFYSNCAEACPPLIARLKETMSKWRGDDRLLALAVTLDPERDTPEALARYSAQLGLDDRSIKLLTGSRQALEKVWRDYGVEARPLPGGVVGHDVRIVLVDKWGKTAYTFYGLDYPEVWLSNALELLLKESSSVFTTLTPIS